MSVEELEGDLWHHKSESRLTWKRPQENQTTESRTQVRKSPAGTNLSPGLGHPGAGRRGSARPPQAPRRERRQRGRACSERRAAASAAGARRSGTERRGTRPAGIAPCTAAPGFCHHLRREPGWSLNYNRHLGSRRATGGRHRGVPRTAGVPPPCPGSSAGSN